MVNPYVDGQPWIRGVPFVKKGYQAEFEAVSDLDRGNTRGQWNAFQHYKRIAKLSEGAVQLPIDIYTGAWPVRYHYIQYPDVNWYAQLPYHEPIDRAPWGTFNLYDETALDGPVVAPPKWDTYLTPMRAYLLNQAKPEASLVNSILELRDVMRITGAVGRVRQLAENYSRVIPPVVGQRWLHLKSYAQAFQRRYRNKRCTYRDVLRAISELYLTWGFAISPMIADLEAIENAIVTTSERIDKIYRRSGQRRLVRYKRDLPPYDFPVWDADRMASLYSRHNNTYPEGVQGTVMERINMAYSSAVLHGQMEYTQWAPDLERRQGFLYGLLDQVGINVNPAIIWNGIPYSFIIDWVINVGKTLDSLKLELLRPVTVVHRCCYSFTLKRLTRRRVRYDTLIDSGWRPSSTVVETSYRRYTDNLGWVAPLATSSLSTREIMLGAALGHIKWPRRRKR